MSDPKFAWAHGSNANVQEPIQELAENGWKVRDIPKASNVNWVFKQIGDEFVDIRKDMDEQTAQSNSKHIALSKDCADTRKSLVRHEEIFSKLNGRISDAEQQLGSHTKTLSLLKSGNLDIKREIEKHADMLNRLLTDVGDIRTGCSQFSDYVLEFDKKTAKMLNFINNTLNCIKVQTGGFQVWRSLGAFHGF